MCQLRSYRTEGPARAAILLVFNLSHIAFFPPVHSFWQNTTRSEERKSIVSRGPVEGSQAAHEHNLSVFLVLLLKRSSENKEQ